MVNLCLRTMISDSYGKWMNMDHKREHGSFSDDLPLKQVILCTSPVVEFPEGCAGSPRVSGHRGPARKPCVLHDWPTLPADAKAEFDVPRPLSRAGCWGLAG